MPIRAAGIAGGQDLADGGPRSIAARDVARLALALLATWATQSRDNAIPLLHKALELGLPLDRDTERLEALDQQPLVLVLRIDLQERIGGEILAHGLEGQARGPHALHPEIDGGDFVTSANDDIREIELLVELEGPCVHRERPRGRPGLGGLVDDPNLHALLGEPERQDEPRGAGADDQNVAL